MKNLLSFSLADITPHNIAQDNQISSLIAAIDPELRDLSQLSIQPLIFARIDELPENILDILAWQLHADFYDLAGTLSMKREAVKSSILWHMHKGTQWAIMEALRQIEEKAYVAELSRQGVREIWRYGIAFCGKKVWMEGA